MFDYVEVNTYKNYNVNAKYTLAIFEALKEIHHLSIQNDLNYHLIGHLALALQSKKIYRTPNDLDILIDAKNLNKWYDILAPTWCFRGQISFIKKFNELKFKKFAASNTKYCAVHSKESQIYIKKDKQIETVLNTLVSNDFESYDKTIARWIFHDPYRDTNQSIAQFETQGDQFRIWFNTNQVGAGFIGEVHLIKENELTIVPCFFSHNQELPDKSLSDWWVSNWIDHNEFTNCQYTICIYKKSISVRLFNKITNISMDLYVNQDQFDKGYNLVNLNGLEIKITYPEFSLGNKYNRKKDNDDYDFYKFLLIDKFADL